jgi:hypothetical protein
MNCIEEFNYQIKALRNAREQLDICCPMRRVTQKTESPMLKKLAIVFGLVAGLSACMSPYGYNGYSDTGYGYNRPAAYYGYSYDRPVYYGAGYGQHGTVQ